LGSFVLTNTIKIFKRNFPTAKRRGERRHGYHLDKETTLVKMIGSEIQDHHCLGRSPAKKRPKAWRVGGWEREPSVSSSTHLIQLSLVDNF
jgi:hypothetical protein